MTWAEIEVSEMEFDLLDRLNYPIVNTNGVIPSHSGVVISCLGKRILGIVDPKVGIRKLNDYNPQFKNSRNRDLARFNDLLTNPEVNTIIVDGLFGTGKTSNIMAHVIEGLKTGKIPHLYLSKPHVPTGNSYGHLPGELHDKFAYEFKSYYQYFDRFWKPGMGEMLMQANSVTIEEFGYKPNDHIVTAMVFEYLRGIDLEEGWIILDESQNTNIQEMASFVSRLGDKLKLIIIGDTSPYQIDRKSSLNPKNNGLAFVQLAYEGRPYSAKVELKTRNHIVRGDRVKHLHDALELHYNKQGGEKNG